MGSHSFTDLTTHKMVAAQVMKCLWVAGLAVAAPQLDFGSQRSVLTSVSSQGANQEQLVSNVVAALQPSIAKAVADALRSSSVSSRPRPVVSTKSLSNSVSTYAEEDYGPAQYNYEYKVADKEEQTFISQTESRDGDAVTGSYSYGDPNGALITVNYEAGPMGYTATTQKEDGFVSVKASGRKASTASNSGSLSRISSSSASSSLNQSDLIARIISSLQPQIQSAVSSALSTSSRTTSYVEQPRVSAVSSHRFSLPSAPLCPHPPGQPLMLSSPASALLAPTDSVCRQLRSVHILQDNLLC